jgi:hypothetical protein
LFVSIVSQQCQLSWHVEPTPTKQQEKRISEPRSPPPECIIIIV